MGPRADWTCLSKKCQQDGAATVYEDLPIETTRCPVCGSKRMRRLYTTAPGIIRSGGRHLQSVIDRAGADAQLIKADNTDARLKGEKRQAPALAVPIKQLAGTLAGFGMNLNAPMGGSRPAPGMVAHPALARVTGKAPMPGQGSLRDTEHAIVNGQVVKS
jgi:hypothetical protein